MEHGKATFKDLKVINKIGNKLNGYNIIAVNPNAFVSAHPLRLSYEKELADLKSPHGMAMGAMDAVHMRFSQGQIWDEFDVEPDEAYRFLGFEVRTVPS